jgi:hypothetical protein
VPQLPVGLRGPQAPRPRVSLQKVECHAQVVPGQVVQPVAVLRVAPKELRAELLHVPGPSARLASPLRERWQAWVPELLARPAYVREQQPASPLQGPQALRL